MSTEWIGDVCISMSIISRGEVVERVEAKNDNLWLLLHWHELQLKLKLEEWKVSILDGKSNMFEDW